MKVLLQKKILDSVEIAVAEFESYDRYYLVNQGFEDFEGKEPAIHRKVQSYFARKLLNILFGKEVEVQKDQFGKPHVENGYEISLSHSDRMVAAAISKNEKIGIDLESCREKIVLIAHKFMSEEESESLKDRKLIPSDLTIYWGAKECMYKLYGLRELDYIKHLHVSSFELSASGNLQCSIHKDKNAIHCKGYYENIGGYYIVAVEAIS